MTHPTDRQRPGRFLRWGNALALCVLVCNLVAEPLWLSKACADPPTLPPTYMQDLWLEIHQNLFGPVEPMHQTAFYHLHSVVKAEGMYTGHNDEGQPFVFEVIDVYHYTVERFAHQLSPQALEAIAASGQQWGIAWATMSTALGAANVLALCDVYTDPSTGAQTSYMTPLFEHDDVLALSDEGGIAGGGGGGMTWNPVGSPAWPLLSSSTGICGPGQPPLACYGCISTGVVWCPCSDPEVLTAVQHLDNCLNTAKGTFLLEMVGLVAAFVLARNACLAGGATGPGLLACMAGVTAAFIIAAAFVATIYSLSIQSCMNTFNIDCQAQMPGCP